MFIEDALPYWASVMFLLCIIYVDGQGKVSVLCDYIIFIQFPGDRQFYNLTAIRTEKQNLFAIILIQYHSIQLVSNL